MRRKKSEGRSPDIIVTFNFNTSSSVQSFGRFADYTNREQATEIEQNAEQVFEEHLEGEDYKKMISYMKRDSAITNSDEKRTGLFNAQSQNMSTEDLGVLKEKLSQAQLTGNNLWNGAVSFDIGFLIQTGILEYNAPLEAKIALADKNKKRLEEQDKNRTKNKEKPKNSRAIYLAKKELEGLAKQRKVNQGRLKEAVQEQMGGFLKAEGFNEDAFWWGSVHLNTKHVHVHVSLSELNNSRKRILNEYTGEKEPRGKFKIRNIERLKSKIFHTLDIDANKKQRRVNEIEVGMQREAILTSLDSPKIPKEHLLLNFYLEEAQKKLPQEGNHSFKSNRKEFREAKAYLNSFIDTYLETVAKDEFSQWKEATKKQLSEYEGSYSTNFNLEKKLLNRETVLKENLGNKILKQLKTNNFSSQSSEEISDYLSAEDYKKIVEDLKDSNIPSKELGKFKYLFKLSQAEDNEMLLKHDLSKLQHFESLESNEKLKRYHQEKLKDKIKLSQLQQIPNFKLSNGAKEELKKLEEKYITPRNLKISEATSERIEKKLEYVTQEIEVITQTKDERLLHHVYGKSSQKEIIDTLQQEKKILNIKKDIHKNNQVGERQKNRELFNELKLLYGDQLGTEKEGFSNKDFKKAPSPKNLSDVFKKYGNQSRFSLEKNQESSRGFEKLSNVLAQLDFKDISTAQAKRAKKISDEREEREKL